MSKLNLKNVVWKEGKSYVSWNINTGVSSFGSTKKEALDSLKEALELYFEDNTSKYKINKVERVDVVSMIFSNA